MVIMIEEVSIRVGQTLPQEKCIKLPVQIVEMNVKYHSSPQKVGLYSAENVSGKKGIGFDDG